MHRDEQLLLELLGPLREQARDRVRAFAEEPLGRFVKVAGERLIRAKVEARTITLEDVAAVVNEAAQVDLERRQGTKSAPSSSSSSSTSSSSSSDAEPFTIDAEFEVER